MKTLAEIIIKLDKRERNAGRKSASMLLKEKGHSYLCSYYNGKEFINYNDKVNSYWLGYEDIINGVRINYGGKI